MYQFYYANRPDFYGRTRCKQIVREQFNITAVRPAMWEEHCLECSAPACFESCVHYLARSDGRCKRFENGLMTFAEERACCGQGARVRFRKWGNMMTVIFPAMIPEKKYLSMRKRNDVVGKMLKVIESSKLPQPIRWQGIRVPEYIRRRGLRKLRGLDNKADAFIFQGYSYTEQPYRLIVEIYDDHTSVYKTSIHITQGENLEIISNLPEECSKPGNLVKIYPENNLEAELDIFWCDFVQGECVVSEQPAPKVKCVVWDLDETLWDGVLIETESSDEIVLRDGIREVMEELDRRGIIQSVASKNDYEPTMAVLERLGISEYFLYPQIHWNPKSGSMEAIAKSLNIGIDALAFVDDTAFERQQVHSTWPQIRIYDAVEVGVLLEKEEFDVPVTEESRNRRKMYRAEEQRNVLRNSEHTDIVEFLRKCNLTMKLFTPETEEEKLRCYELAVRTNQLNMSGKKYTPEEFEAVLLRTGHRNFAFSCEDDFGEYGIVGFGQYRVENETLIFTEFAMSCRVAGKFVESALFAKLLDEENCKKGCFIVQKTKKNELLRNSLEQIGFSIIKQENYAIEYQFSDELKNAQVVTCEKKL